TYALNDFLTYKPPRGQESWPGMADFSRKTSVPHPSDTMWMGEMSEDIVGDDHFHFVDKSRAIPGDATAYYPNSFLSQVNVLRHLGSANYLFVDGHVESLPWTRVKPMLKQTGSYFVKPDGHGL
ncbi:MAG TPA: H-X9-DG-CTERM domain-containing protein, partial [Candidatus Limnocylindria bacterium]|nr:H-X9-DG-CTERM domain-containing protein [Candidatus Limnocylindria bacterium]